MKIYSIDESSLFTTCYNYNIGIASDHISILQIHTYVCVALLPAFAVIGDVS